jgi:hypothetical protein
MPGRAIASGDCGCASTALEGVMGSVRFPKTMSDTDVEQGFGPVLAWDALVLVIDVGAPRGRGAVASVVWADAWRACIDPVLRSLPRPPEPLILTAAPGSAYRRASSSCGKAWWIQSWWYDCRAGGTRSGSDPLTYKSSLVSLTSAFFQAARKSRWA